MPITFEPRQAYNEQTSIAYGAALARREDRDFGLRAGALAQESASRQQALAQQQQQFEEGRQVSERDQFQAQNQSNDQMNAIALRAQYESLALNQAEQQRMTRLQGQMDYIDANTGEGRLYTPEDGAAYKLQLKTGLDPLKRKAELASIARQQADTRHIDEQTAMNTVRERAGLRHLNGEQPEVYHHEASGRDFLWTPQGYRELAAQRDTTSIPPQTMARFVVAAHTAQQNEIREAQRTGRQPPSWAPRDPSNPTPAETQAMELNREQRVNEMVRLQGGSGGATTGGYQADRSALMTDLGSLLGGAAPYVTPRAQPAQQSPVPPSSDELRRQDANVQAFTSGV